jgi:DNA primase
MNDVPDDPVVQKVREAIDTHLRKVRLSGSNNIVALCPFHDDSTPSFSMSLVNGLFICFSCGEKGNFRKFLAQIGMSPEEIKYHYGRTLEQLKKNAPPPPDPTRPGVVMETNRHVPEELLGIFHQCPVDLIDEGFDEATLEEFQVGVDLKHQRITYPIRDLHGHLVGISGRAMHEDQMPRYKVYDKEYTAWELPPYDTDKGLCLWNAHNVYAATRTSLSNEPIAIVEGFKACMWLKQAGVKYVTALMTNGMSWAQLWMLSRMGSRFIVMLDNNDAGVKGTINVTRELAKITTDVRVVEYEEAQPSDVPREDVLEVVYNATPYDLMLLD